MCVVSVCVCARARSCVYVSACMHIVIVVHIAFCV